MTTYTPEDVDYPHNLLRMHRPPGELFVESENWTDIIARPHIAIVGSRQISPYGRQVTQSLARELAQQGIVIVSGLALGVDAVAHTAALEAGGLTVAILPTPLSRIAPSSHQALSRRIIKQGGALISSYPPGSTSYKGNFVARNEIVAALSNAVIITEAATKSGSRHTAQFALDMGIPVLAVPGNITSPTSTGTNQLLKTGAHPITGISDVLAILGLPVQRLQTPKKGDTPAEQTVLNLLAAGSCDGNDMQVRSHLSATQFNQALTMLEITGAIRALGGNQWTLT